MKYLLAAILLISTATHAQLHDSLNLRGKSEISISWGVLSLDQWRGIFHNEAPRYGSLVGMPNTFSGAAFLTYRYHVSNRLAISWAAGLDNQHGLLSYGGPHSGHEQEYRSSGEYSREFYTVAAEALCYYERWQDLGVYFLAGAGITAGHISYATYPDALYNFNTLYTPISEKITHFNAQVTPIGFRAGGRLSCFIELGFGYKGMVCAGASFRP